MDRRLFLARLSAIPLVWKGLWSARKIAEPVSQTVLPLVSIPEGMRYQYVRTGSKLKVGDVVYWEDRIIGVAVANVDRGNFGLVCVNDLEFATAILPVRRG